MMARGQERIDAVLDAVTALVVEVGYPAVTMDAVAARAHASKATIYRHFGGKAELVKAALDAHDAAHNVAIPDTGALRGDLVAVLESLRELATDAHQALLAELIAASRHDGELAAALYAHRTDDDLSPFAEALRRAVRRGELPSDVDELLVHDVAEAMVLRQLQIGEPLDDAFVARLVDDVLLVLLHRRENRT